MNPKALYTRIFESKASGERAPEVARDALHRFLLDPVFDPFANPRPEVALSLLEGGERLLDLGCWNGGFLARVAR
jgi:hypothetical protein